MSLEKAKAFLHDKVERLEELGEEFLNDLKNLFEKHTGEQVPGDLDGDGIPDDQQQAAPIESAEPVTDVPAQAPLDGAIQSAAEPTGANPVTAAEPAQGASGAPTPAASPDQVDPVSEAEPAQGTAQAPESAPEGEQAQSAITEVPSDESVVIGNQSAESVTGAQDVLKEVPDANLPKGIVPEATVGVNIDSGVDADSSVPAADERTEPAAEGDSTETQVKKDV